MSDEIVLWKLKDLENNNEMDIKTPFIVRVVNVPTKVRYPLYSNGELISDEELSKLNLTRVGYTQDQLDAIQIPAMYESNPDLLLRVKQYKNLLDTIGAEYTSSLDEINALIKNNTELTNEERATLAIELTSVYDAIITNLEYCGSATPHMDAYQYISRLIKYIPQE